VAESHSGLQPFSKKQLTVMTWWQDNSPYRDKQAIICDGAVRSGKTFCMGLSFVLWAFYHFSGKSFAFCGKTILSLRRNLVRPLTGQLERIGISYKEKVSENYLDITLLGRRNRFYLFGGKDEGSAAFIQGITLAGVLFDEVALMPRSFVEQALARCSVDGSRFWFNCNPEHPHHWFYTEWIQKRRAKKALYLQFKMSDNPSLSPDILRRYKKLYSGVFYQRFVLGRWVVAQGLVYPMFSAELHVCRELPTAFSQYVISCDYGTVNPASFGLWGESGGIWYRMDEYYYDARREGVMRTDREHGEALERLAAGREIAAIIVDPSAASFMEQLRRMGRYALVKADNDVVNGIRRVSDALKNGAVQFSGNCADSIREFALYRWNEGQEEDHPVKQDDHAMDDIRYFISTWLHPQPEDHFYVASLNRS